MTPRVGVTNYHCCKKYSGLKNSLYLLEGNYRIKYNENY
jgi:hypothetical protein